MTNTAANASEVRTCIERALDEYVDKALNVLVDCEEKQRTIDVLQQNEKRIESACTELRKELSDLQTKCSTLASRCESVSEKSTAGLTDQKTETELRKRLKEATDSLYAAKNEALQRRRKFDIMQLVSDNQKLKIDEMAHRMREFQHQKQMQVSPAHTPTHTHAHTHTHHWPRTYKRRVRQRAVCERGERRL